jgi:hypothetical protein
MKKKPNPIKLKPNAKFDPYKEAPPKMKIPAKPPRPMGKIKPGVKPPRPMGKIKPGVKPPKPPRPAA